MKLFLFVFIFPSLIFCQSKTDIHILNPDYGKMLNKFLSHTVPEMSCKELSGNFENYILLDTRTKEEFDLSHLKNARWIDYNNFKLSLIKDLPTDKAIVCYCSIGYRSEKIAKKLIQNGYKNVHNLYGSIFEWTNLNLPLYNNNAEITFSIHGYNKKWSRWIDNKNIKIIY